MVLAVLPNICSDLPGDVSRNYIVGEREKIMRGHEVNYSKEWEDLIRKKEDFEKASFFYNHEVEEEKRRTDLIKALNEKDIFKQLSAIQMMGEGYLFPNTIELCIEKVVEIAITGQEECVGWAGIALNHLDKKKWKSKIIDLIIQYTEKNKKDEAVFHFAWLLLYRLGYKQALKNYIQRYEEYMIGEFDEEDWSDIENMIERY